MGTFKNTSGQDWSIPVLGLHVKADETFEVPEEFEGQFDANPAFTSSRVKNPDVVTDPNVAASLTGPVPIVGAPENIPA